MTCIAIFYLKIKITFTRYKAVIKLGLFTVFNSRDSNTNLLN